MGKSALMSELNQHVVKNASCVYGKFDSSKSKPYSATINAASIFYDTLVLEDECIVAKHCSKTKDVVGEEGKLLTNIINNLCFIIGKQPDAF